MDFNFLGDEKIEDLDSQMPHRILIIKTMGGNPSKCHELASELVSSRDSGFTCQNIKNDDNFLQFLAWCWNMSEYNPYVLSHILTVGVKYFGESTFKTRMEKFVFDQLDDYTILDIDLQTALDRLLDLGIQQCAYDAVAFLDVNFEPIPLEERNILELCYTIQYKFLQCWTEYNSNEIRQVIELFLSKGGNLQMKFHDFDKLDSSITILETIIFRYCCPHPSMKPMFVPQVNLLMEYGISRYDVVNSVNKIIVQVLIPLLSSRNNRRLIITLVEIITLRQYTHPECEIDLETKEYIKKIIKWRFCDLTIDEQIDRLRGIYHTQVNKIQDLLWEKRKWFVMGKLRGTPMDPLFQKIQNLPLAPLRCLLLYI